MPRVDQAKLLRGTFTSVNCYARDAAGINGGCVTSSAEIVKVALSINSDSSVRFTWDENGNCSLKQVRRRRARGLR
jgi:hypothetical protein